MKKKELIILIWAIISILLFIFIIKWGDYLIQNNYIIEKFQSFVNESSLTTQNVNLPLTTTTSCTNICGPNSRCYKTGQQCLSDLDCPGCKINIPGLPKSKSNEFVPGNNDAGKLTSQQYPTYSVLTTDMGTQANLYSNDRFQPAPQANFGENGWRRKFNIGYSLFNERYKPQGLNFMPNYPNQPTLSGEFETDGPLPSNAYLPPK